MPRTMRLPYLVLFTLLAVSPVRAQVAGHPVEIAGGGGLTQFDARDKIKPGLTGVGSIGYRWSTGLVFEYGWLGSMTKRDDPLPDPDHTFSWTGLDLRFNLRDPSERYTPFLLAGYGFGR